MHEDEYEQLDQTGMLRSKSSATKLMRYYKELRKEVREKGHCKKVEGEESIESESITSSSLESEFNESELEGETSARKQ